MYANKTKTQSPESKEKAKFRQSAKWKKFRQFLKKECKGVDFITGRKLYKGFQVHHLDMRLENYKNLDRPEKFLACNKQTHEAIHWLYKYYENDPLIIDRLKTILEEMKKYN